ncbi:hypothetical protein D3C80_892860 [compost metagenome]
MNARQQNANGAAECNHACPAHHDTAKQAGDEPTKVRPGRLELIGDQGGGETCKHKPSDENSIGRQNALLDGADAATERVEPGQALWQNGKAYSRSPDDTSEFGGHAERCDTKIGKRADRCDKDPCRDGRPPCNPYRLER